VEDSGEDDDDGEVLEVSLSVHDIKLRLFAEEEDDDECSEMDKECVWELGVTLLPRRGLRRRCCCVERDSVESSLSSWETCLLFVLPSLRKEVGEAELGFLWASVTNSLGLALR
jgi:hypothetical protein